MKALAILLASCVAVAHGATYHVATNGNDLADGSAGTPWATVTNAAARATTGDVVIVSQGSYGPASSVNALTPGVDFAGDGFPSVYGFNVRADSVTVRGFNITNSITVYTNGNSAAVISNRWENTFAVAFGSGATTADWIRSTMPSNMTIAWNLFSNTAAGLYLRGHGGRVVSNYFTSTNSADAIVLAGCNYTVGWNTFSNWSRASGSSAHVDIIQSFSDNGERATNNVFCNNAVLSCSGTQIGNLSDDHDYGLISDWTWRNNIWVDTEAVMSMYNPGMKIWNNTLIRSGTNSASPFLLRSSGVLLPFTVDADADVFTVDTNKCVTIGQMPFTDYGQAKVQKLSGVPSPLVNRGWYYVRLLSPTTLSLHTNLVDATNETRINVTASGDGFITTTGYRGSADNSSVWNNIFVTCGTAGDGSYSVVNSGAPWWMTGTNTTGGSNVVQTFSGGTDPLFVTGDYKLSSSSPCIGAATNLSVYFTTDYAGVTRGETWDIGAYAYTTNAAPEPPAPSPSRRVGTMRVTGKLRSF